MGGVRDLNRGKKEGAARSAAPSFNEDDGLSRVTYVYSI